MNRYEAGFVNFRRSAPRLQSIVNTSIAKPTNQSVRPRIANNAGIEILLSDTA